MQHHFETFGPMLSRQPTVIFVARDVITDNAVLPYVVFFSATIARANDTCAELWHLDDAAKSTNVLRQPLVGHRWGSFSIAKVSTSPSDNLGRSWSW